MNRLRIPLLAIVALFAGVGHPSMRPGDLFYGEVVSETKSEIQINIKPCAKDAVYETIPVPFRKSDLGEQSCPGKDGKKYIKVKVEQLPPPPPPPKQTEADNKGEQP